MKLHKQISEVNRMQETNDIDIKSVNVDNQDRKHLIEDALFQDILEIREDIYHAVEINVSVRKLVNMLLRQSNMKALRDQLIQQYS